MFSTKIKLNKLFSITFWPNPESVVDHLMKDLSKSLTFKSMEQILWCYHSNETSSAVLSHVTIYLFCSSNCWVCRWNPMVWPLKWNLVSRPFASHKWFLRILYKEVWNFWEFCPLVTIRSERGNIIQLWISKLTPFQWNHLICYPFESYFWGVDYS